jgi:ribosomal protein L11 methyltransferase
MSSRPELAEFVERARGLSRQAQLDAAAAEVLDGADALGVEPLLLKGPALARTLYAPGEHRGYCDIDLLVSPRDLARARRALSGAGFKHAEAVFGIDDVAGILHSETWSRRGKGRWGGPLLIDLHWRLPGCEAAADAAWEALAARRSSIDFNGREAAVLDREGLAVHVATHAAQHGPDDLKAIADLTRALERWPPEVWRPAASLAAELGATAAFAAGLRLVPAGAARADELGLPPSGELDWTIRHRELRPRGTFHIQALARAPGARARASVLRRSLLPSRRWIAWEYPWAAGGGARLFVAYGAHLLRTPLWAARALRYRHRERRAGRVDIASTEIARDRAVRRRAFQRAMPIAGGRLVVMPPGDAPGEAEVEIVIDARRAFGAGDHATTQMCLELLLELADGGRARGSLADLGTGSGVLAIAAARLGWSPVVGLDHEREALTAARVNAAANQVKLDVRHADLRREPPPSAETLVANLGAAVLVEVAYRLLETPRTLICSGLLATESDRVADAFAAAGLEVAERRVSGDWTTLRLER